MFLQNTLVVVLLLTTCSSYIFSDYSVVKPPSVYGSSSSFSQGSCCDNQTMTMQGSATIEAVPDQAFLSASIKANGKTTQDAINALSVLTTQIISILKKNSLTQDNYKTTSFNTYPNTSFVNGVSTILGQIASQSFQITIPKIDANGANIGKLFDELAVVNGIVLNGLSFDLSNKTKEFESARTQAFQNAQQKANDYASFLMLSVVKILNVNDMVSRAPVVNDLNQKDEALVIGGGAIQNPTTVNVGTIPISYDVEVVFGFRTK